MPQATIQLHAPNKAFGEERFEHADWRAIVWWFRSLLAIEVAPYWAWGDVTATIQTEDDRLRCALYGVAVCYGMVEEVDWYQAPAE